MPSIANFKCFLGFVYFACMCSEGISNRQQQQQQQQTHTKRQVLPATEKTPDLSICAVVCVQRQWCYPGELLGVEEPHPTEWSAGGSPVCHCLHLGLCHQWNTVWQRQEGGLGACCCVLWSFSSLFVPQTLPAALPSPWCVTDVFACASVCVWWQ